MPSHPLTNFEIRKYYQNEPKFDGVYLRNNLFKLQLCIYNKSWGVSVNRNSLHCFVCECWKYNIFW